MNDKPRQYGVSDLMIKGVIALIASIPLVGFIFGAVICHECGSHLLNRLLAGAVFSVLSTINLGMPPVSKDGGQFYNLWPWIALSTVVLIAIYLAIKASMRKRDIIGYQSKRSRKPTKH